MLKRLSSQRINRWQFSFQDGPLEEVSVPHSWNGLDTMRLDETWFQRGVGEYKVDLETAADRRTFIRFGAASQKAAVFWDGAEIGRNEGGYLPFTVELPEAGQGVLRVEVDNAPDIHLPPSDRSDFFLYGGLTRPVTMYTTGAQRIERLKIDPKLDSGDGRLGLTISVDGDVSGVAYKLTVLDPQGKEIIAQEAVLTQKETGVDLPTFQAPALWSPDSPNLYRIRLSLMHDGIVSDKVETHFGWRTFNFPAGGPFYLNGERVLLRGTHRHEDWAGCASAVSEENTRAEFELIKSAGMNFIRLGHYPQADFVHTLCDELGLIVWDEIPWCRGGIGGERFKDRTRNMLRTMIAEHRHHPSIIFWGMGNELDWEYDHEASTDDKVFGFLQELHDLAHELDPSRLTALRRYDRGAQIVDVYSPSIWSGWYRGRYQDYETVLRDAMSRFPRMIHTEWGGDNHVGRHSVGPHIRRQIASQTNHEENPGVALSSEGEPRGSLDSDWSESYILDLMEWHLQIQNRLPNLAGTAQWAFKDFGTPLRPENPIPYVNQKGLVDRSGRPKDVYFLFKAYQTDTPVCHIESPTWPIRAGDADGPQRIRVYSNCERVELFVNGRSAGTKMLDPAAFPARGLVWSVPMQAGENKIRAVATPAKGEPVEHTISQTLVPVGGPVSAISGRWDGENGLATVQLVDEAGIPVLTDERRVTFDLAGSGRLLADQGTPTGSRIVETANGRASIHIFAADETTILHVNADNLPAYQLKIN